MLALLAGLAAAPAWAADDGVVLGILESPSPARQQSLERDYGMPAAAVIRMTFRKTDAGWQAFDGEATDPAQLKAASERLPSALDWTVAFDGRVKGHVAGKTPAQWKSYADIGLQLIPPGQPIIRIGKPSRRWSTDGAVYRPLVVLSRPQVADPDAWQPTRLGPPMIVRAIAPFRAAIASANKDFRFADSDLRVVAAYRSRAGRTILALRLNPKLNRDDGPPGPEWSVHWFVIEGSDAPRFLDRATVPRFRGEAT